MFQVKDIPILTDALSRDSPKEKTEIKGLDVTIHELTTQLLRIQVESIQKATQQDKTLQLLIQQVLEGWPESCMKTTRDPETILAMEGWLIHWTPMHHLER